MDEIAMQRKINLSFTKINVLITHLMAGSMFCRQSLAT